MFRSSPINNGRQIRDAFTLIELIVVLIIIGVMSAVAVPRLSSAMANRQLTAAKRRIELDLAQTQQRARFTGVQQKIKFDKANSKYWIQNLNDPDHTGQTYTVELDQEPYNATIAAVDFGGGKNDLKYDGFGQPLSSGYVTLDVGGKRVNVLVTQRGVQGGSNGPGPTPLTIR